MKHCLFIDQYAAEERFNKAPQVGIIEFANSVAADEMAHNEPPHLDLHCLPTIL